MKKINSNRYGTVVLGMGLFLLIGLPLMLYIFSSIFSGLERNLIIKISAASGGVVLSCLGILLLIEFRQDKKHKLIYQELQNTRQKTLGNSFECQKCGSRSTYLSDRRCPVCGTEFENFTAEQPLQERDE